MNTGKTAENVYNFAIRILEHLKVVSTNYFTDKNKYSSSSVYLLHLSLLYIWVSFKDLAIQLDTSKTQLKHYTTLLVSRSWIRLANQIRTCQRWKVVSGLVSVSHQTVGGPWVCRLSMRLIAWQIKYDIRYSLLEQSDSLKDQANCITYSTIKLYCSQL